jgi:hypothetical protein
MNISVRREIMLAEIRVMKKLFVRMQKRVNDNLDIVDYNMRGIPFNNQLGELRCSMKNLTEDIRHCAKLVNVVEQEVVEAHRVPFELDAEIAMELGLVLGGVLDGELSEERGPE